MKLHHKKLSRFFPAYHPKAGQSTYFVEKLTKSIHLSGSCPYDIPDEIFSKEMYYICEPKHHTIRAGNSVKVGDKIRFSVWSLPGGRFTKGNKSIVIAPDIQVKKVWDIEIYPDSIRGFAVYLTMDKLKCFSLERLANNDGLELNDFLNWFSKPFTGQIICWSDQINY